MFAKCVAVFAVIVVGFLNPSYAEYDFVTGGEQPFPTGTCSNDYTVCHNDYDRRCEFDRVKSFMGADFEVVDTMCCNNIANDTSLPPSYCLVGGYIKMGNETDYSCQVYSCLKDNKTVVINCTIDDPAIET
ncbi:hypothetical protein WDU94_000752 [Cyamophila willieti]